MRRGAIATTFPGMARFNNIGKALRFLREDQGWSQKDLAQAAGITGAMLSNYETGEKKPSLDSLGKLLDALGLYLGTFDDALDVVNKRTKRRESLGIAPRSPAVAPGRLDAGGEIDVQAFIGAEQALPADLEQGFVEMIKGFRQIARYMYRVATRRTGG